MDGCDGGLSFRSDFRELRVGEIRRGDGLRFHPSQERFGFRQLGELLHGKNEHSYLKSAVFARTQETACTAAPGPRNL